MFFQENGQYRCAVYLRLSRSDGDQQESNSIKNQRALLNDYLGKHPELHKVDEYVDDGFHSAGMCLLEAEGFHPCRQVGFAGI